MKMTVQTFIPQVGTVFPFSRVCAPVDPLSESSGEVRRPMKAVGDLVAQDFFGFRKRSLFGDFRIVLPSEIPSRSGSVSQMLVLSATEPLRAEAPVRWARASTRVVLPEEGCPTKARLRMARGPVDIEFTLRSGLRTRPWCDAGEKRRLS